MAVMAAREFGVRITRVGEPGEGLDEIVQSFYRTPDAFRAVRAFEAWLRSGPPSVVALHALKSAAVWSLKANAAQHPSVARLCELEAAKQGGAARFLLSR
jgi:hypothetical protein